MKQRACAIHFTCLVASLLGLAAQFLCIGPVNAQPLVVEQLTITTSGGTARGWLASVSLQDPAIELAVTAPPPAGSTFETTLQRTDQWRSQVGAKLAVNANYFGTLTATTADLIGLSVSNGTTVSPIRQFGVNPDPAIVFDRWRHATVDYITAAQANGAFNAVAGVGPSNTDTDPGTLLITDGINTGATARVDPSNRNPRTALGIDRNGTTLFILVIDGRQPSWSVGMTLPELADYLLTRGAWRAINLDGGGSSAFVYLNDSGTVQTNRPSDGAFRAVGNNLGVFVRSPVPDRVTRPIRGAWLRPPTTIASFESTVATLAAAGIQDIFLESLYWGQDTGLCGVFPSRFGFDYLKLAIVAAAKYGVRIHAWCETGYLDYGGSPSALLQQHPDWIVKNRDPANSSTGDIANQRFVNLGNPAVQSILASHFTQLAARYPGLAGIQADYNFFPLAASGAAPWSYDAWARTAFSAQYGVDPINSSNTAGTTWHPQWLTWNRANVAASLVAFRAAIDAVSTSPIFSAVGFADWSSSTHTSKMIDLPRWCSSNASDVYFVMSYFSTTSAIITDLGRAQTAMPGRRIVAGLANLTGSTRPAISDQLNAAAGKGIEDWSWFDAPTLVANPAMLSSIRAWIDNTAHPQRGDVFRDGYIDARDLAAFDALYTGTPVPVNASNIRYDLDGSGLIDAADRALLVTEFRRFHFGEDGVVDGRDLQALIDSFTPGNPPPPATPPQPPTLLNLWDLDGNGVVNYADQLILHAALTVQLSPDLDVDRNGVVNIEDLIRQQTSGIDVNRDGVINTADSLALSDALRAGELAAMASRQR